MEPLPPGSGTKFEFENSLVGQAIPPNFVPAIEKGFKEAVNSYVAFLYFSIFRSCDQPSLIYPYGVSGIILAAWQIG